MVTFLQNVFILLSIASFTAGHWMDNNIIGPTCAGNPVLYSNVPEYDDVVKQCDPEVGHCRSLCILSKLGMMNTEGHFLASVSKPILQQMLPPLKNRFRATELTGAFESCSLSFNFNENLNVVDGCSSYAQLLDCFRKSAFMICEGVKGPAITSEMGNAANPWPADYVKPGDTNEVHNPNPPPPLIPTLESIHQKEQQQKQDTTPSEVPANSQGPQPQEVPQNNQQQRATFNEIPPPYNNQQNQYSGGQPPPRYWGPQVPPPQYRPNQYQPSFSNNPQNQNIAGPNQSYGPNQFQRNYPPQHQFNPQSPNQRQYFGSNQLRPPPNNPINPPPVYEPRGPGQYNRPINNEFGRYPPTQQPPNRLQYPPSQQSMQNPNQPQQLANNAPAYGRQFQPQQMQSPYNVGPRPQPTSFYAPQPDPQPVYGVRPGPQNYTPTYYAILQQKQGENNRMPQTMPQSQPMSINEGQLRA